MTLITGRTRREPPWLHRNRRVSLLVGFALIGASITVGAVPLVLLSALPARASWPYLIGSVVLHVAYNLLLMRSYRLGEFGQVYPIARGTSPLLVALAGAVFVGEHLSAGPPARRSPPPS